MSAGPCGAVRDRSPRRTPTTYEGHIFDEVAGDAADHLEKVVVVKVPYRQPKSEVLVARRVLGVRLKRRARLGITELGQEAGILAVPGERQGGGPRAVRHDECRGGLKRNAVSGRCAYR